MSASSSSGGAGDPLPDLKFPTLEPRPAPTVPASPEARAQVIELSELYLPQVTARPDFEEHRLRTKPTAPFRLLEDGDPVADPSEPNREPGG